MANFTTTTSAVFIPEIWSKKVLVETERKLIAAKHVSRYDADVSGRGDVVHIPIVSNFSQARDKSSDTDVTFDAITESEKSITIDQHKYVAFVVEDRLAKQSAYDLTAYYGEKAGYEVAKAVDTDVLALFSDLTTTDAGSYEADISAASMVAAIQELMGNDVPEDGRVFMIHARQAAALLNVQDFVTVDFQGQFQDPTRVQAGVASNHLYGTLYGIPVYYTNNVATTSGTTTSVHNMLFHKEAFALAMQISPRVQKQYRLEKLADTYVVDTLYGVTTTRPTFGVELRSNLN